MTKKILSLFFAVIMILSVMSLAACGGNEDDGKGDDTYVETLDPDAAALETYLETYRPEDTAGTYVEVVNKTYDYEGYDFTFLNSAAIWYMYIYLDPDMTGDVLDDCCFEINLMAEEKFNITISEETQP